MPSDQLTDLILFFLLTLIAEILGTLGGFGSSVFFVSILQLFIPFSSVLTLTGLLHIFSNTSKVFLFRKSINWKLTAWLGISSLVLAIVGAYLTSVVNFEYSKFILGIFLIGISALFLFKPDLTLVPNWSNSITGGSIAGFLAGFIGTGGAVRGLVLASFNLEKNLLIGTSAAIDFGVDLSRTIVYVQNGFFEKEMWIYLPLMFSASLVGTYLGKILLNRISQEQFRQLLLGAVMIMGIIMIISH